MTALDHFDRTLFAARLTPHRSLDRGRVKYVLAGVAMASALVSLPFFLVGAWPVIGFMGLDVFLLWLAFRASFRAARAYEDLTLTCLELAVAKISAQGSRSEWRFNPQWVRLERLEDPDSSLRRLSLASRGRHLEIGGFLGPDAKAELAQALSAALAEARRGPRLS
jgi:uncharacterized membrane protein